MNDIGIGAVGAALIAGLVSILGLIIGKEQKVSEFRQKWIDDLRGSMIAYLVHINSISDTLALQRSGATIDNEGLLKNYRALNEANHGIVLRINPTEPPSQALATSMANFEVVASSNSSLTPSAIKSLEADFVKSSKELLKYEWEQVKKGEKTYVITKRVVIAGIVLLACLLVYFWLTREESTQKKDAMPHVTEVSYQQHDTVSCSARVDSPRPKVVDGRRRSSTRRPRSAMTRRVCPSVPLPLSPSMVDARFQKVP